MIIVILKTINFHQQQIPAAEKHAPAPWCLDGSSNILARSAAESCWSLFVGKQWMDGGEDLFS
eukprot:SAG31_NODE_21813_length_540_cov_0.884354_1_plen_62_part_10